MQNDALFPMLTVRETIRFAAYLRVAGATRAQKNKIADKTISLLRLDDCADTIVGDNDNRGISGMNYSLIIYIYIYIYIYNWYIEFNIIITITSFLGGQKRRVSIAVDIVHEPSVIFLDEPTR